MLKALAIVVALFGVIVVFQLAIRWTVPQSPPQFQSEAQSCKQFVTAHGFHWDPSVHAFASRWVDGQRKVIFC